MPKPDDDKESDHEVFIGYQSGAVGMFKIWIKGIIVPEGAKEPDPDDPTIEMCHKIYIAPQKITADVDMKHVLAMLPLECSNPDKVNISNDFKLAVGYNGR